MKIRFDVAEAILMGLATDDYMSKYDFDEWKKLIMAWFYQVPNDRQDKEFFDTFQEFTKKAFQFYKGDKVLDDWLEENIKFWGWCGRNAYKPEGKHYRSTLWKILSEYNNKEFIRLASKDKGVVEDKVLNTIRDYDNVKNVFELWNFEITGGYMKR